MYPAFEIHNTDTTRSYIAQEHAPLAYMYIFGVKETQFSARRIPTCTGH